jgi:hypothetical protein
MAESRPKPLDYAAGKARRDAAPVLPAAETTLLEGLSRAFVLFLIQSLAFLFLVGCVDDSKPVFSPRLVFILMMVLLPSLVALAIGLAAFWNISADSWVGTGASRCRGWWLRRFLLWLGWRRFVKGRVPLARRG